MPLVKILDSEKVCIAKFLFLYLGRGCDDSIVRSLKVVIIRWKSFERMYIWCTSKPMVMAVFVKERGRVA